MNGCHLSYSQLPARAAEHIAPCVAKNSLKIKNDEDPVDQ